MRESINKSLKRIKDFKIYKETCQSSAEALKYLSLHRNCPYGQFEYGLALMREKRADEAKIVFEKLLDSKNRRYALVHLILIEFIDEEYEKCIKDIKDLEIIDNDYYQYSNFEYIKDYCMFKLNITPDIKPEEMDYMESIIFNYNKETVLNHVVYHNEDIFLKKSHLGEESVITTNERFFASDIDVSELFDKLSQITKLDEIQAIKEYSISSKVFFKYHNIGSNDKGKQDYFVLYYLTGTDRIISFVPVYGPDKDYLIDKKPVFDFEQMYQKAMDIKVKAL